MSLPNLSGTGRLYDDPELRFAPSGTPVCKVPLAFNSRKRDGDKWVDGDSFFVVGTVFNKLAENAAETLNKGMEVVVTGRLKTRQYETKEGDKRSVVEMLIDSIGPGLAFATAKVAKVSREGGRNGNAGDDEWANASTTRPSADTSRGSQGFDEEPPF